MNNRKECPRMCSLVCPLMYDRCVSSEKVAYLTIFYWSHLPQHHPKHPKRTHQGSLHRKLRDTLRVTPNINHKAKISCRRANNTWHTPDFAGHRPKFSGHTPKISSPNPPNYRFLHQNHPSQARNYWSPSPGTYRSHACAQIQSKAAASQLQHKQRDKASNRTGTYVEAFVTRGPQAATFWSRTANARGSRPNRRDWSTVRISKILRLFPSNSRTLWWKNS